MKKNNLKTLSFNNLDSNENIKESINDLNELYKNKEITYKLELEKANSIIEVKNKENKNLLEENKKMKKKISKYKNLIKEYKNSTKNITEEFYNKINSEKNELLEKIVIFKFENKKLKEEKINLEQKLDKFFKNFSLFFRDNLKIKKNKLYQFSKNNNFFDTKTIPQNINFVGKKKNNNFEEKKNFSESNDFLDEENFSISSSIKFIDKSVKEKIDIYKNSEKKKSKVIINSEMT